MLPDPAQPHGHALAHSAKEHWYDWPSRQVNRGFRVGARTAVPAADGAGDPGALSGPGRGGRCCSPRRRRCSSAATCSGGSSTRPNRGRSRATSPWPPGATRADTLEMMRELQRAPTARRALRGRTRGQPAGSTCWPRSAATTGPRAFRCRHQGPDQLGSIAIELIDADLRPYSPSPSSPTCRTRCPPHPMLETVSFRGWRGGPGGDSLSVQIFGAERRDAQGRGRGAEGRARALTPRCRGSRTACLRQGGAGPRPDAAGPGAGLHDRRARPGAARPAERDRGGDLPRRAALGRDPGRAARGELTADFLDRRRCARPGVYVPLADIVTVESRTGFSTDPARERHPRSSRSPATSPRTTRPAPPRS
jgi:hypothetical protein